MPFEDTSFKDLLVFTPRIFEDSRGYFFESYSRQLFQQNGVDTVFIQDNEAKSSYGVVRGLHFQNPLHAQTKLLRVIKGSILDAVVDLRNGLPTYGQSFTLEISEKNKKQLLIPKGFAHGYSVLEDDTIVAYKCDGFYNIGAEGGLLLSDAVLKIDWRIPTDKMIVSEKDTKYPLLENLVSQFNF